MAPDPVLYSDDLEELERALASGRFSVDELSAGLLEAARWGRTEGAASLLAAGADPNAFGESLSKRTPRPTVALALVRTVVQEDGSAEDPAGPGDGGAAESLDTRVASIVRLLLTHGAEPDRRDPERGGGSLLSLVCNYLCVDAARALLDAGADPNLRTGRKHPEVALYEVFTRCDDTARQAELTELLLDRGAQADVPCGAWERTPLMLAAANGSGRAVERLLAAGANPNAADRDGHTAFELAAAKGHQAVCKMLVAGGATAADSAMRRARFNSAARASDWEGLCELAEAVVADSPDDAWVYTIVSRAFSGRGDHEAALAWASRGYQRTSSDELVARLLVANVVTERYDDAVAVWDDIRDGLVASSADPFVIANVLAAMGRAGYYQRALAEVGPVVDQIDSRRDGGLMRFNAACVASMAGDVERAVVWVGAALAEGKDLDSVMEEPDLAAARSHPAFALVVAEESASRTWRTDPVRELAFARGAVVELEYRDTEVEEVVEREFASRGEAAVAFAARAAELDAEAEPTQSPAVEYHARALENALADFHGSGPLGALVVEWDFGDDNTERNYWVAGYRHPSKDVELHFHRYVYGDGAVVDTSIGGPPVLAPSVFRAIVARVCDSAAFAGLEKQEPFYFVLQEHDAGHEVTVRWPAHEPV